MESSYRLKLTAKELGTLLRKVQRAYLLGVDFTLLQVLKKLEDLAEEKDRDIYDLKLSPDEVELLKEFMLWCLSEYKTCVDEDEDFGTLCRISNKIETIESTESVYRLDLTKEEAEALRLLLVWKVPSGDVELLNQVLKRLYAEIERNEEEGSD
jgi:hypothetical protein